LGSLEEIVSTGKSGSFLYRSYDNKYLLKTLPKEEAMCLFKILPQYYQVSILTSFLILKLIIFIILFLFLFLFIPTFLSYLYFIFIFNLIFIAHHRELPEFFLNQILRFISVYLSEERSLFCGYVQYSEYSDYH
jgi:hypothetical protein